MPSGSAFYANLKVHVSLLTKARLIIKNNYIKIIRRRRCCGNLGEPGC